MPISHNRITIAGRVGGDPEQSGDGPARFSVATSRSYKDRSGNKQEQTQWHRVVVWPEATRKFVSQYVRKGDLVLVEGRMEYRVWEKDGGEKVNIAEVVVAPFDGQVQLQSKERRDESSDGREDRYSRDREEYDGGRSQSFSRDLDDEIPF